ncbi:MAG: tRNA uridine-5-carboxymethylaminomethyl(34) synthesis GTPase MnmE [Alphaproteobacteria bacterium]|nr:tRNA uridine-5-carboxymethylaminomethyl(34) synthesis GTPase MnmE [Alphaproteobacteria bacterium]
MVDISSPDGFSGNGFSGDTIFALATPQGRSAVQIIRISGPGSARILRKMTGAVPDPRQAHFTALRFDGDNSTVIDQALVLFFKTPASATGEDTAELHLHGSPVLGQMVMEWLETQPRMRLADRGEFTRRAFLNGKVNLDQAEGIADIIDADTIAQHQQAMRQLDGALSAKSESWRGAIIALSGQLEALIDFADEDLPQDVADHVASGIAAVLAEMEAELASSRQGLIQRDGVQVAIVGRPNAGKSTLLNHLIGDDRAIVSPEAGTTRDLVQVALDIDGVAVHLTDTAGIRFGADQGVGAVEEEGVKRALRAASDAHLVLMLIDGNDDDPADVFAQLRAELPADMADGPDLQPIITKADAITPGRVLPEWPLISVQTGLGMVELDQLIRRKLAELTPHDEAPVLTRQRHVSAVRDARDALDRAGAISLQDAPELLAEEFRLAAHALGRITGRVDVEDVLDHIFSSFCIGK